MKRTFIAFKVHPGKEIMHCMSHLKDSLKGEKIKWVDNISLHVTMTFIGDTGPGQIESVGKIMETHVPLFIAPELIIKGLGLFRSLSNPRVIWLGINPIPAISDLKLQVDKELGKVDLPVDKREFRPHLTLGRIRHLSDRTILSKLIREYHNTIFLEDSIDELVLFESVPGPGGPVYVTLKRVRFKCDAP
jgi:RNA 2',3'-cyclic 3'-phosphodiesterase